MDKINDIATRYSDKLNGRKRDNSFIVSMDNFLRYLRTIENKPVPVQISVGATGGFLSGYFLTRVSKFLAACTGISLIIFQFMNYKGYIKLRRNQLQRDFDQLAEQLHGSSSSLIPTSHQVEGFLSKNLYLIGGFIGGNMIGYSFA